MNELVLILVGFAVATGLFALGVAFVPRLAKEKQGYTFEAELEQLMLPYLYDAIATAYRTSERAMDDLRMRLKGADKAAIAGEVYRMLPDQIGEHDLSLVKSIITRERFVDLVQDAFDRFDRFYVAHKDHFDKLYEEWRVENQPTS